MISILVLSNRDHFFEKLRANLEETVGCPYELLREENVTGGIAAAYNKLAAAAAHPALCFLHDDVLFHSTGWGPLVIEQLERQNVGVVGVMGGRYKSAFGLGWRDGRTKFYRMTVKSGSSGGKHLYMNPENETESRVLCLDGAFLCCRKAVWQAFPFDAERFSGFHFYDIDFTFRIAQQFENYVVYGVVPEHFSSGRFDENYWRASLLFERKHRSLLPYTLEPLSRTETAVLEGYTLTEKLTLMKANNAEVGLRGKLLCRYFFRYGNVYQLMRNLYFAFLK